MQNKTCFMLSLAIICYISESSKADIFDDLDTDVDYETEEQDLNTYSKLLDKTEGKKSKSDGKKNSSKSNVKTSGFKKKNEESKGVEAKYDLEELKKFFKTAGIHDKGAHDDAELYAVAEGIAAGAVGVSGTENRKYNKGTKTRGFHRIHHKDEYKKDKEFFEDDVTKGSINKFGGKALGVKVGAGAGIDKGHFHHDREKSVFDKEGLLDKGYFDKEFKGFSDAQGFEASFKSDS